MLTAVCQYLARAIARDGEGATCLIEVQVAGATDEKAARQVARTIAGSSLVKSAVFGRDPNWGVLLQQLDALGFPLIKKTQIKWGFLDDGSWSTSPSTASASAYLKQKSG